MHRDRHKSLVPSCACCRQAPLTAESDIDKKIDSFLHSNISRDRGCEFLNEDSSAFLPLRTKQFSSDQGMSASFNEIHC